MYLCCAAADRSKCIRKDIHQIGVRKGNALDRTTKKRREVNNSLRSTKKNNHVFIHEFNQIRK